MAAVLQYLTMASVSQRKTLDDERQRVGELVQPPREVSHVSGSTTRYKLLFPTILSQHVWLLLITRYRSMVDRVSTANRNQQPPGQRHLGTFPVPVLIVRAQKEGHPVAWIAPRSRNRLVMEST